MVWYGMAWHGMVWYAGVMLNFFSGWPIGPAKIYFGWPAVSFTCPRYYNRFWGAYNNYHNNQQNLKVSTFSLHVWCTYHRTSSYFCFMVQQWMSNRSSLYQCTYTLTSYTVIVRYLIIKIKTPNIVENSNSKFRKLLFLHCKIFNAMRYIMCFFCAACIN